MPVYFLNPNTGIVMTNTSANTSSSPKTPSPRDRLIKLIAKDSGIREDDARKCLNIVISNLSKILAEGERIAFPEFGSFSTQERPGGEGRNPRTGETIQIKPYKKLKFVMAQAMKKTMNTELYPSEQQTPETKKAPAKKAKK